ncbi:MAG: hypothetical protein ABIM44_09430 [candidate division WOR-3 bacterium]
MLTLIIFLVVINITYAYTGTNLPFGISPNPSLNFAARGSKCSERSLLDTIMENFWCCKLSARAKYLEKGVFKEYLKEVREMLQSFRYN